MRYLSETVSHEVFDAGAEDVHGNSVPGWLPGVPVGIYAFNPGGSSEPLTPGHDRVVVSPVVWVASSTVVGSRDRMVVRGKRYEVDGEPLDYRNPYDSIMDSVEVRLKAVAG